MITSRTRKVSFEIRLGLADLEVGQYQLVVLDLERSTKAGPFLLQFPSETYALEWFDKRISEGSRNPKTVAEAKIELASGFIVGEGDSSMWGGIVDGLFHSNHYGPFLVAPWWSGAEPPYTDHNPMLPGTHVPQETLDQLLQVFVSNDTHQTLAIRRQVGQSEDSVQFLWWRDGTFTEIQPGVVGDGSDFLVYTAQREYSDLLGPLARGGVPYPEEAAAFFIGNPKNKVSCEDFRAEELDYVEGLLHSLRNRRMISDHRSMAESLKKWVSAPTQVPASELAAWIGQCMVASYRFELGDTPSPLAESKSPLGEAEEADFYEALIGPDGGYVFALHHIIARRGSGETHFGVLEHEWRVDDEWDESFPDELDDWRWIAETERLQTIPDKVAAVNVERGLTDSFLLAWDVSDAIRINDHYRQDIEILFDLPIDIPVGLVHWMSNSPEEVVDASALPDRKADPRWQVAASVLDKVMNGMPENPPGLLVNPVATFAYGKSCNAEDISRSLVGLLLWIFELESACVLPPE